MAETIERIVRAEIPVMGHVGLTPQAIHRMGGHRVQGRTDERAGHVVLADALAAAEEAGAFALVLEGMPARRWRARSPTGVARCPPSESAPVCTATDRCW